jgi:hypothetical protein
VSGGGDNRITVSPTASNGDDAAEISPAVRCPIPSAAHTASTPIVAATGRDSCAVDPVVAITPFCGRGRLTVVVDVSNWPSSAAGHALGAEVGAKCRVEGCMTEFSTCWVALGSGRSEQGGAADAAIPHVAVMVVVEHLLGRLLLQCGG